MWSRPSRFAGVILPFASLFGSRTWGHAERLLIGAILTPGRRTVASVLRVLGLARVRTFCNHHRVLSRAVWSARAASGLLLRVLVRTFVPRGPVVVSVDDTLERRRGKRIAAKGVYRDPVAASYSHMVKATGLRWVSVMLLAPIPWARRVWALPFLTALAPSERYATTRGLHYKRLTEWARQLIRQVHRWLPARALTVVTDGCYASLGFLHAMRQDGITVITRFRLDARLHAPVPVRRRRGRGQPRVVGPRVPKLAARLIDPATRWRRATFAPWYGRAGQTARTVDYTTGTALWYRTGAPPVPIRWVLLRDPAGEREPVTIACTDLARPVEEIVRTFVQRWQVEVTFEEVRRHLGVETQRQWSDRAIARTTPVLLALFSLVTLLAHRLARHGTARHAPLPHRRLVPQTDPHLQRCRGRRAAALVAHRGTAREYSRVTETTRHANIPSPSPGPPRRNRRVRRLKGPKSNLCIARELTINRKPTPQRRHSSLIIQISQLKCPELPIGPSRRRNPNVS